MLRPARNRIDGRGFDTAANQRLIAQVGLREEPRVHLFALAAAILALGSVYWLVRYGDRRGPVLQPAAIGGSPALHMPQSTD